MSVQFSAEAIAQFRDRLLIGEGQTPQEVCEILDSSRPAATTAEDIYFCFRLLLGRSLNREEASGHLSATGQPLEQVVGQFLRSLEFADRNLLAAPEGAVELVQMDGYGIYVDPNDHAVGRWVVDGTYEDHITSLFRRMVKPGNSVVDIGANLGYFCTLSAHLVGCTGSVVAIEPNPSNCRYILASRKHNGFDHLTLHSVAASSTSEALVLNSAYSNGMVSNPRDNIETLMRSQIVPGIRLDDLVKTERLDFIKIDVEGHEYKALCGFIRHLERFRPAIVSEFSPTAMPAGEALAYLDLLFGLGYRISVVNFDGTMLECGIDPEAVMRAWHASGVDHIDFLAEPLSA